MPTFTKRAAASSRVEVIPSSLAITGPIFINKPGESEPKRVPGITPGCRATKVTPRLAWRRWSSMVSASKANLLLT